MNFFERHYYGNPLYDWIAALVIGVALALTLYLIQRLLLRRLSARAGKTPTRLEEFIVDILSHTRYPFLLIVSFYFGLQYLELPPKPARLIEHVAIIALLVQVALWGNRGIAMWLADYLKRHKDTDAAAALKTGKVDAYFGDAPVVAYYIARDPKSFAFGVNPVAPIPVGIALRKGDPLIPKVRKAVAAMYADGTMQKILAKWKMSGTALKK